MKKHDEEFRQCCGINKRTGSRCMNSVLMEYTGDQPEYCAEHIESDPQSLYTKCRFIYHNKNTGRLKCKELVLKEFGLCYKHFRDYVVQFNGQEGIEVLQQKLTFVESQLSQLSQEASKARNEKYLYQRKYKLMTKFQAMRIHILRRIKELSSNSEEKSQTTETTNMFHSTEEEQNNQAPQLSSSQFQQLQTYKTTHQTHQTHTQSEETHYTVSDTHLFSSSPESSRLPPISSLPPEDQTLPSFSLTFPTFAVPTSSPPRGVDSTSIFSSPRELVSRRQERYFPYSYPQPVLPPFNSPADTLLSLSTLSSSSPTHTKTPMDGQHFHRQTL